MIGWVLLTVVGMMLDSTAAAAPKPLYRDPVFDGAADPVVVWNRQQNKWFMLYTNRRANAGGTQGVEWVHGTRIGIASSSDGGISWKYERTANIDYGTDGDTHWAPDVFFNPGDGRYHMFLTFVPGVHRDWNAPRRIVHLTSADLIHWSNARELKLASDGVIDACVLRMADGSWRLWYNNERDHKSIYWAKSADLNEWTDLGKAVGDQPGEGPKVFRWRGEYWMIVDEWKGLAVYRSDDATTWKRQERRLLEQPGTGVDDGTIGHHADVVVTSEDRAYLFYFTHPGRRGEDARKDGVEQRRSSIQVVELEQVDDRLSCDRDALTRIKLLAAEVGTTMPEPTSPSFPVRISIDASKPVGEMKPIWRFFGADEPNYAYMKDGRKLLGELGKIGAPTKYFRAHNLLTTGDGTPALKWGSTNAYTEDAQGKPIYDWTIVDRIFDAYRDAGMKPYVQIGFMPEALSSRPQPYRHHWTPTAKYEEIYTGWAYPPKDYAKWGELVFQWTKHCVEKYGQPEVERWYWETWNEANIGYWRGTKEEFYRLHDVSIAAVRRALPTAHVGGPDSAGGGRYLREFLEHCVRGKNYATGETGTPTDFVSFHAKGRPTMIDGHVRMGIADQLRGIDENFGIVASFPELKEKPIVIGESDPEGCAACQGPQLGYRNGTMYSSYTAASFARKLMLADKHGVNLEGALTWAFEFEEQAYFAGFRVLASNGIDLPVLNVFRMFGKMTGQRVSVESTAEVALDQIVKDGVRSAPDVSALASVQDGRVSILLWHYHDDDVAGPDAGVDLQISGLPIAASEFRVTRFQIDAEHSNAFTAWKRMGSPPKPSPEQYVQLEKAGQLEEIGPTTKLEATRGRATLRILLPRQAVALVVIDRP